MHTTQAINTLLTYKTKIQQNQMSMHLLEKLIMSIYCDYTERITGQIESSNR